VALPKKAVVLLSGGIDSSTTLAIARAGGYDPYALSFDYSQRHRTELEAARKVAGHLGARRHLIIRFDLREIGGSALTAEMEVPKGAPSEGPTGPIGRSDRELETGSQIPVTYVPARNTIFLSFALAWAEVLGAQDIFIGANVTDYSGYPDCRPEYLAAFEEMANLATKASVEGELKFSIRAPLLNMSKAEIIKKGAELGLDYSLTWSCYDPQPDGRPCLRCDSCRFRAKGFREAGVRDPLL
jgi:7-cyano-7-deazaguanine synthase